MVYVARLDLKTKIVMKTYTAREEHVNNMYQAKTKQNADRDFFNTKYSIYICIYLCILAFREMFAGVFL